MPCATPSMKYGRHALALALGLVLFAPQAFGQTLTLSGSGENTARSEDYLNYTNLLVDSGTWHLHGPLVSDTAMLRGGAKIFLNADTNLGSGLTTIDGATLQAEAANITLNQQLRVQVGSLIVDGSNMLTFNNIISGGGGINKIGTGELVLRNTNTYNAATMIGNGVLNVQANNATSTGVLTFNGTGNGVLRSGQNVSLGNFFVNMAGNGTFDTPYDLLINGRIGGSGTMTKTGAGRLRFTGPWINMGNVVLRDGTIDMGTNVELGGGSLIVYKGSLDSDIDQTFYNPIVLNGDLTMNSARNWNFAAPISGLGNLELTSSSTTTLSGSNTFTGNIGLRNGTLVVASTGALGTGNIIMDGGLLTNSQILGNTLSGVDVRSDSTIRSSYNWALNGALQGNANLSKTGAGTLTLGGDNTAFTGVLLAKQGLLNVVQSYNGTLGVDANATVQFGNHNDDVFAQTLNGRVALGAGDDRFTIHAQNIAASSFVDGQSGHNTLVLDNPSALYELSFDSAQFVNFSALELHGALGISLLRSTSFVPTDPTLFGVTINADSFLDLNGATLSPGRANILGGLYGSGVIDGALYTSGVVAPSGIPNQTGVRAQKAQMGDLRITGDLNTTAGEWFIHTDASGSSDRITVAGTANISGATVVALPQNGTYADRTVYSFLHAGNIVGSFDGVVQNTFAFLTASLDHRNDGVDLILERYVAPPVVIPPPVPPVVEPPVVVPPVVVPPPVPPVVEPPVVVPPVVVPPPLPPVVEPPVVVPPVVAPPPVPPVVEPPVVVPPVVVPPPVPPVVEPPVVVPPVVVPPPLPPVVEPPVVVPPVVAPPPLPPVVEPPVVVPPPVPPVVEPPIVVQPVIPPVQPPLSSDVSSPVVAPGNTRYDEFSGLTRNQRSMARALQESEWYNGEGLDQLLGQVRALQKNEVVNAFDQLTGESYASLKNAEADALQYVLDLMNQREIEEGLAIWGDALWFETALERNENTSPVTSSSHGFIVGVDNGGEHLRGGVYALAGKGKIDHSGRNEDIQSDRVGGGVKGQWNNGAAQIRAAVGYIQSDISATRNVSLGANRFTTVGKTQADTLGMALEARYTLARKNWLLTPIVGVSRTHSKLDGFSETSVENPQSQLRVASSSSSQTIVASGLSVGKNIVLHGSNMRLYIDGKYMRNLDHTNDTITTSFAANSMDFEIVGSRRERQWWNTAVGVDLRSKSWTLTAQAQADMFKSTTALKVNVSATYRFK